MSIADWWYLRAKEYLKGEFVFNSVVDIRQLTALTWSQWVIQGDRCPVVCVMYLCGRAVVAVAAQTGNKLYLSKKSTGCDQVAAKELRWQYLRCGWYSTKINYFHFCLTNLLCEAAEKFWKFPSMYNPLQITDCLLEKVIAHRIQRETLHLFSIALPPQRT